MRITGFNPPPELADIAHDLITTVPAGSPDPPQGRGSKRSRSTRKERDLVGQLTAVDRIVAGLAQHVGKTSDDGDDRHWRYLRRQELLKGVVNPVYWMPARILARANWTVAATGTEQLPRPAYDYQTPGNRPTVTEWGAPYETPDQPAYSGELIGDLYHDTAWTYAYSAAILEVPITEMEACPAFAQLAGTIDIATDARASRPMCSLLAVVGLADDIAAMQAAPRPPVAPATSHYWRFDPPAGAPPYYQASLERSVLQQVPRLLAASGGSMMSLTYGLRPMLGHGNNNNTAVDTLWNGDGIIYTPTPCPDVLPRPVLYSVAAPADQLYTIDPETGAQDTWRESPKRLTTWTRCHRGWLRWDTTDGAILYNLALNELRAVDALPAGHTPMQPPQVSPRGFTQLASVDGAFPPAYRRATYNYDGRLVGLAVADIPYDGPTVATMVASAGQYSAWSFVQEEQVRRWTSSAMGHASYMIDGHACNYHQASWAYGPWVWMIEWHPPGQMRLGLMRADEHINWIDEPAGLAAPVHIATRDDATLEAAAYENKFWWLLQDGTTVIYDDDGNVTPGANWPADRNLYPMTRCAEL